MKTAIWTSVGFLAIALIAIALRIDAPNHHFGELQKMRSISSDYFEISLRDRMRGIGNYVDKMDYHLRELESLGLVKSKRFVFTNVPYTRESSGRLWDDLRIAFPDALYASSDFYAPDDPGYGVDPIVFEVWDRTEVMPKWDDFFETHNRPSE